MRAFKPEMQPQVVRTATQHCFQQTLNRSITHLSTNSSHLFFLLSRRNMSDVPCTCKNSYWLYFVGSVDYVCLTCHVSYHLLNTQGSAPGLLTVSGNTDTITGPIFSPGATSASGTVPALSPQRARIIYFVKTFREFNLPKDCPLVCPQGRGMKLSHYKERKKASYSSFSSLLCEEHAQLK